MISPSNPVKIERLTSKHVDVVLQAARESVQDTFPWMEWCRPDLERVELAAFMAALDEAWENGNAYTFAILDTATDEFLGVVGLNRIHHPDRFANLHYWVRSSKKGRGIATLASRQLCRYGIEELGLQRMVMTPESWPRE